MRKANWQKFKEHVEQNFDGNATKVITTLPADKAVREFNNRLNKCCEKTILKKRLGNRAVPWWNEQLTDMRRKVTLTKKSCCGRYDYNSSN